MIRLDLADWPAEIEADGGPSLITGASAPLPPPSLDRQSIRIAYVSPITRAQKAGGARHRRYPGPAQILAALRRHRAGDAPRGQQVQAQAAAGDSLAQLTLAVPPAFGNRCLGVFRIEIKRREFQRANPQNCSPDISAL